MNQREMEIDKITTLLRQHWKTKPQLRFVQLVNSLYREELLGVNVPEFFYSTDEKLIEKIKKGD